MSVQVSVVFGNSPSANRPTYDTAAIGQLIKAAAYYINSFVQGQGTIDYKVQFDDTVATSNGGSTTVVQLGAVNGARLYDQSAGAEWKTGIDPNGATNDALVTIGGATASYFFDTTLNTA